MATKLPKIKIAGMLVLLVASLLAGDISHPTGVASAAAATGDSCTPPSTTYGTDTIPVTVNASDTMTYTIWTRLQTPNASSTNSILLNIDGAHCYNVGGNSSMASNTWNWINYSDGVTANPIQVSLAPGPHSFTLTGTQSGMEVDVIEALSDPTCLPTGDGSNCVTPSDTTPPSVSITAPANAVTVSGATTVTATAADDTAVANVQFKLDGQNLGSADVQSPYSYSWDTTTASNGVHTLTATATDTSNNTTSASISVTVNNSGGSSPPIVTGDLDGDGHVTGHDLSLFLSHYGTNYPAAEFDGGASVEGHDLSILLSNYGK